MIDKPEKNKMISADDAENKGTPTEHDYFFPHHNKTIKAVSLEEANRLLEETLKINVEKE